jgi:hypothetical protein
MLPEISRRCLSCGASARAGARFCPQCGKAVGVEDPPAPSAVRSDEGADASGNGGDVRGTGGAADSSAPSARESEAAGGRVTPAREFSAFVEDLGFDKPREGAAARAASGEAAAGARAPGAGHDPLNTTPVARPVETAEGSGEAPAAAAAGVSAEGSRVARARETARARVERIRDDARAALEETPDDAGLRFVVAAVALFALFLFFLFLSLTVLR